MVIEQHDISSGSKLCRSAAGAACLVLFLMIVPARSFAACESSGAAMAAAGTIAGDEEGAVATMVKTLEEAWTSDLDTLRAELGVQDQADWNSMIGGLNTFWHRWQAALKNSTAQLSSGTQDQSRQRGSINDASNELAAAEDEQQERLKSTFQYQPTDQACRFDTAAEYLAEDEQISTALSQAFEWDFASMANNEFGPAANYGPGELQAKVAATGSFPPGMAQNGPGELQNERWTLYTQNFCDYQAEDCNSGCSPAGGRSGGACTGTLLPYADVDVLPSKMLFSKYTINLSNPIALAAMDSMIFNVTGYQVPEPIVSGALGTVAGIEQMFARREYIAQMSAAGSLLYSVVADSAPGKAAPEVQMMREMMNGGQAFSAGNPAGASDHPSVREIRQSIIEQLWDPNFYKNLGDNPSTMGEKELYLKAYGLVMLYDMISKQEKISTAYAIETAAMLENMQHSRAGFTSQVPVQ